MDERRKSERKQTQHFFGLYDQDTGDYVGKLVDLSIKGMMVRAEQLMDTDCIYEFRIELPKPIARKTELLFDAKCMWCVESTHLDGKYDAGFEISDIKFEEIETIQYLLNDSLFQNEDEIPRISVAKKIS